MEREQDYTRPCGPHKGFSFDLQSYWKSLGSFIRLEVW